MTYHHQHETEDYDSPEVLVPIVMAMLKIESVVDVGCGLATWLKIFKTQGVQTVLGIESASTKDGYSLSQEIEMIKHDLADPYKTTRRFDLALCLEVAEHLEEGAANTLVDTLTGLSDYIIFSAAIPGQGGQHHVNEQWPDYWAEKFAQRDFIMLDPFRKDIWQEEKVAWYYRQNIVLLAKSSCAQKLSLPPYKNHYVHPQLFQDKVNAIQHIYQGKIGPRRAFKIFWNSLLWRFGF